MISVRTHNGANGGAKLRGHAVFQCCSGWERCMRLLGRWAMSDVQHCCSGIGVIGFRFAAELVWW